MKKITGWWKADMKIVKHGLYNGYDDTKWKTATESRCDTCDGMRVCDIDNLPCPCHISEHLKFKN